MQLHDITKTYGSNNVLDHIDFDFGHSQIVGLIGKMVSENDFNESNEWKYY